MRIEERNLVLPALYIINQLENVSTNELIKQLTMIFKPTGEDAAILKGRKDSKFSQKVRNLVSHRATNKMDKYTNFIDGKYTITALGEKYLNENDNLKSINYLLNNNFDYKDIKEFTSAVATTKKVLIYSEDDMITEGKSVTKQTEIKIRSNKLRKAAIIKYSDANGNICCCVCGFNFSKKYGILGKGFIEIHHEKPIYQYADCGFEECLSEAVNSMKPLCSNCHRMIHRNQKEPMKISELKSLIK